MWTILIQTFSTMITHPEPALHLFLSKEEKVLQDLGNQGGKRNSEPTEQVLCEKNQDSCILNLSCLISSYDLVHFSGRQFRSSKKRKGKSLH